MRKSILTLFASIAFLVSCSDDDSSIETSNNQNQETNTVKLADNSTFGNILTDADGNTLYFFSKDTKQVSECSDGCKAAWPIFYTDDLKLDNGLDAADFGTITREDGDKQTTYKGWPLYYYANDNTAGDTNGDGVGNNWYVAKPDYTFMYGQAEVKDGEGVVFYMTSATGRTVYLFANDTNNDNNYTNDDFSNDAIWPIISKQLDKVPSILDKKDFGSINVFGRTQLTYKGWPLYYFGSDVERGDANGVSGVWPIVNTDTSVAPVVDNAAAVNNKDKEDQSSSEDIGSNY